MLEGLEISEVEFSWIKANNFDYRIDSEYFLKKYTHIDSVLSKVATKCTKEISSKITDGTHYTPDYQDTGYKFFSAINVSDNYFDADAGFKYISEKEHKQLFSRCNPMQNDVLLRKVGVGDRKACVVPKMDEQFSIFVSVALIKCKSINPYFLSTFINSKYGQSQLLRFNKGIGQPDLHLEDIARCQIPMLNETFQLRIEQLVKIAHKIIQQSKEQYTKAENLLVKELGLENWQPSKDATTVQTFGNTQTSNRWDAEYYQPKFEELKQKLLAYANSTKSLSQIADTYRGDLINDDLYCDDINCSAYIRGADISSNELKEDKMVYIDKLFVPDNEIKCQLNDIVFALIGSVGTAALVTSPFVGSYISNNLGLIRITDNSIKAEYLHLFLTTPSLGGLLFEQKEKRTAQPKISDNDIWDFPVPLLDSAKQDELAVMIQDSMKLEAESQRLLEVAKRTVEIAIEEDEEKAIQYINEYGKSLYDK